jgi:hypothetical protein
MLKGQTPAKDKIKKEAFENLCGMWCTLIEIADFFGVSEDTVESWCKDTYGERFSDIYKKKCSKGNISLRRWQLKSAEKGNVTMQIWLGKQHLGQKEKLEVDNENSNGVLKDLVEALSNAKKS